MNASCFPGTKKVNVPPFKNIGYNQKSHLKQISITRNKQRIAAPVYTISAGIKGLIYARKIKASQDRHNRLLKYHFSPSL